jgi:hypothetical protein
MRISSAAEETLTFGEDRQRASKQQIPRIIPLFIFSSLPKKIEVTLL